MSKPKTANDYVGYRLFTNMSVDAYKGVNSNGSGINKIRTFEKGIYIGRIYSWVQHNGQLWWMVEDNPTGFKYIFVKHKEGSFAIHPDLSLYRHVMPPSNYPSFSEALAGKIGTWVKYAALAATGIYLLKSVLVAEIDKPKETKVLS